MMEQPLNLTTASASEIRNINTQTSEYLQNSSYSSLTPMNFTFWNRDLPIRDVMDSGINTNRLRKYLIE